ncbi:MAG: DNA mismatch repair endonuclease MutL [Clostridiales bacterium]|nr:DNA mismatch repair endonuclease MutL [Clostridiales bacterium]
MPDIIKELPEHVANLIAAGEVVQRPASVVKELLENSSDAGAKKITVEFSDGGMTFLRVSDDGCGMSPNDARTAFLRHATSKIALEEDLDRIVTMGFRGEALASIAAVSRIDLITRERGSIEGTAVSIEGGTVTGFSPAGCPEGTTVVVRDLFFNTPARMKYVKKDATEAAAIVAAVQEQAVAHTDTAYRLLRDGREVFATSGGGDLKAAIYDVFGRDFASSLTEVKGDFSGIILTGYITRPTASRGSRSAQHFIVNRRPVRSRLLSAAAEEGCKTRIPAGRFPGCVICLEMKPTAVDVNVHPAKLEVKFSSERDAFDAVYFAVMSAMSLDEGRPELLFRGSRKPEYAPRDNKGGNTAFHAMTIDEYRAMLDKIDRDKTRSPGGARDRDGSGANMLSLRPPAARAPQGADGGGAALFHPDTSADAVPGQAAQQAPPARGGLAEQAKVIGEALKTYIIVEQEDGLLLIDKHAAHERILFERLKADKTAPMSQMLLSPEVARFSPKEAQALISSLDLLRAAGFDAEDFGGDSLIVRAIPACLDSGDAQAVLQEIAGDLLGGKGELAAQKHEKLLYRVACRAAVKAGRSSDIRELNALAYEVLSRDDIRYCPHGRPVAISISKSSLDRQFGR